MKKLIIFCFICFSNIIYANPVIIYQYYINGINTTRQEADKNTNRLNKDLKYQNYLKGNLISNEISLLYNEKPSPIDAGIFKQIIDSLLQKANEKYNFALKDVVDSVMEVYGFIYPKDSNDYIELSNSVQKHINELYITTGFNFDKIVNDFETNSGFNNFKSGENKYFILIGHSQGNFYANEIVNHYKNTIGLEHFALLPIATPAGIIEGYDWNPVIPYSMYPTGQKHITSSCDIIRKTPGALPSNYYQSNINPEDTICHSLILTYLNDDYYLKSSIVNSYQLLLKSFITKAKDSSPIYIMYNVNSNILNNYENYPYYKDLYVNWYYVFLNDEQEYSVNSLVSSTIAPGLDKIISNNFDIINNQYNWDCVLDWNDAHDDVEWKYCNQCIETSNSEYAGVQLGSCGNKLLNVSLTKSQTVSEVLIEAKAVPDNKMILTNKFHIMKHSVNDKN